MKLSPVFALTLLSATAVYAASPASGELTEASGPIAYTGGPFVASNPSGDAGEPICEPDPAGALCDIFALEINVSQEFRDDEANKKEVIRIAMSFSQALDDFDLYVYDGGGALVAESAGGSGVQEAITLPLSVFKNGSYTILVAPYAVVPGAGYEMAVAVGRNKSGTIAPAQQGGSLAGGLGWLGLLGLFGIAALKRARASFIRLD